MIENYDSLFVIVENFITNYKFKFGLKLESLSSSFLKNSKFFFDSHLSMGTEFKFFMNLILKVPATYLINNYEIENISTTRAQCPFPEEPIPLSSPYHGFPTYFVDFSKVFTYRLPNDMICERFEAENFKLGNLIKERLLENNDIQELKKIYFPIFTKAEFLQNEEYILYGLLKFAQKTNEDKFNLEIMCLPWNFIEFCSVWEDITKAILPVSNVVEKLHCYFLKVPAYYSSYFFHFFQFKKLNELCVKKWKFLNSNIDITLHIAGIKKNIYEQLRMKKKVNNIMILFYYILFYYCLDR